MSPALIDAILQFVTVMMNECFKQNLSEQEAMARLRKPGLLDRFRLENFVRDHEGLSGFRKRKEWQQRKEELMPEVYGLCGQFTEDDLKGFVANAKDN